MIVMPLVLVSILSAVTRLDEASALGRISVLVLGILLLTTALSAVIGIGVSRLFQLPAEGLVQGARELERGAAIEARALEIANLSLPRLLLSFIPYQSVRGPGWRSPNLRPYDVHYLGGSKGK